MKDVINRACPQFITSRDECKAQIEKFSGAAFKKFNTASECTQFIAEKSGGSATTTPVIPNPVASRALLTKPSGSKLPKTSGTPPGRVARTAKFTAPQRNASSDSTPSNGADPAFLANLGGCLKRRSTNHHDTRPKKIGRYDFEMDEQGFVHIYTDGSCVNNGKSGAKAGLGVYFGEDHPLLVVLLLLILRFINPTPPPPFQKSIRTRSWSTYKQLG